MSIYKKQYPGVYTEREQQLLDEARQKLHDQVGQGSPFGGGDANETLMKLYANSWDPWNPLFNDEEYAKNTKYGGIIAIPCWKEPGAMFPTLPMDFGDRMTDRANLGGAFEMFAPIRPGDTLTAKVGLGRIIDVTPEEGADAHTFYLEGQGELYNQNGELVMRGKTRGRNGFSNYADDYKGEKVFGFNHGGPGGPGGAPGGAPGGKGGPGGPPGAMGGESYTYTDDDWNKIMEMWKAEKIRGADTLYWEDVSVGDQPQQICTGPITEMDLIRFHCFQLLGGKPFRDSILDPDMRKRLEPFKNKYGVYYEDYAMHYCGLGTGGNPMFYNTTSRNLMIRMVTNWMGDDGWLRSIDWHFSSNEADSFFDKVPHMKGKAATNHGACGECMVCSGYVTDKYVNENGEHMVDMTCWAETWDKKLTQVVGVSVVLPSRGE